LHRQCHQRGSLHTTPLLHSPRQGLSKAHKWGNYERLSPASLFPTPVRDRPRLAVPTGIPLPSYAAQGLSSEWGPAIPHHTQSDLVSLRASAQLAKKILTLGGQLCKVINKPPPMLVTHSIFYCPIGRRHHQ
jgi:methionyl aminopeptidase